MSRKAAIVWTRFVVIVAFVALIEFLCQRQIIKPLVMIPPSEMATALWELITSGRIKDDIIQTFTTVAISFAISVVIGFVLGALIHALPRVRRAVDPLLASYYSIPFFVFYPLLIALFGLNTIPLIVIGFVFAMASMIIATLTGLDRVPRVMTKTARILRLSPARAVLSITLPSAAPYLFTGLKLALAYSFIGVIAGEFILSGGGLGFSIAYAYNNFDAQTMYALMLFVLIIAIVMNGALHIFEQRIMARRAGR